MKPSAVTTMMQGVWDGMSPAYNRVVDERIMAPAANLVVAAVEDYWEDRAPRREGEPPCMAHGDSSASQLAQPDTLDDVPTRACRGLGICGQEILLGAQWVAAQVSLCAAVAVLCHL